MSCAYLDHGWRGGSEPGQGEEASLRDRQQRPAKPGCAPAPGAASPGTGSACRRGGGGLCSVSLSTSLGQRSPSAPPSSRLGLGPCVGNWCAHALRAPPPPTDHLAHVPCAPPLSRPPRPPPVLPRPPPPPLLWTTWPSVSASTIAAHARCVRVSVLRNAFRSVRRLVPCTHVCALGSAARCNALESTARCLRASAKSHAPQSAALVGLCS